MNLRIYLVKTSREDITAKYPDRGTEKESHRKASFPTKNKPWGRCSFNLIQKVRFLFASDEVFLKQIFYSLRVFLFQMALYVIDSIPFQDIERV